MISLLVACPLFFGWLTEEMIQQQQQIHQQANLPPPPPHTRPEPSLPENRRAPMANEPSIGPPIPNPRSGLANEPGTEPPNPNPRAGLANEPGSNNNPSTIKTNDANLQAIYWLSLNDQQQYAASWLAAGSFLKDVITQPQWVGAMKVTRDALGTVRSRKLISTEPIKQLMYGTKGTFSRLTYQTQFSGGSRSEIVILTPEGVQGQWRVIGYQIKK